jgi:lipoprotein-anchoring transpeptidase ErfK/SrfK
MGLFVSRSRPQTVRRWLTGAGMAAAVGAAVLSLSTAAGAATSAPASAKHPASAAHPASSASPASRQAAAVTAAPAGYQPVHHVIYFGDHGPGVRRVQRRLAQLHYYPGKVDGQFGNNTLEAVWAFKEVQGLGTGHDPNDIGLSMERALVHPRLPRVLRPHGGSNLRVEVNQNIEVLVLYHHNKVELISHVSSGGRYYYCNPGGVDCGYAVTPNGHYRFLAYWPGWVKVPLGEMFNPFFFIGRAYAVHGDTSVPLDAASHGCVRIPMDISYFFHKQIRVGTPIYISGRV